MSSLLRVEWLKMRKYNAFWWIMLLTLLSYPGITIMSHYMYQDLISKPTAESQLAKMALGNPFSFPEVWHTLGFLSSLFVFIPSVVVIMLITNEYSFKTHRQNIIDGWSRSQFITSKLVDVGLITFILVALYFTISLVVGIRNQDRLIWKTWEQVYYVGLFALQTFSQLSIAFLIGFLIRKAFLSLGVFIFYFLIFENIAVSLLKHYRNDEGRFLPLEISDRILPPPAFWGRIDKAGYEKALSQINLHVLLTIGLTVLIWVICYAINRKRDLK